MQVAFVSSRTDSGLIRLVYGGLMNDLSHPGCDDSACPITYSLTFSNTTTSLGDQCCASVDTLGMKSDPLLSQERSSASHAIGSRPDPPVRLPSSQ
jgi:hypothetical protein